MSVVFNLKTESLRMANQAIVLEDTLRTLQQLRLHHESMAKPLTTPCTKAYNKELANECRHQFDRIRELFFDE